MDSLQFIRTSQGVDVFLLNQRIGAIIDCPSLALAFFRSLSGYCLTYPSVGDAIFAVEMAVTRAEMDGALRQ